MSLDIKITDLENENKLLIVKNFSNYLNNFIESAENGSFKKYELNLIVKTFNEFKDNLGDLTIFHDDFLNIKSLSSDTSETETDSEEELEEGQVKLEPNQLFKNILENNFNLDKINLYKKTQRPIDELNNYLNSCKEY